MLHVEFILLFRSDFAGKTFSVKFRVDDSSAIVHKSPKFGRKRYHVESICQ